MVQSSLYLETPMGLQAQSRPVGRCPSTFHSMGAVPVCDFPQCHSVTAWDRQGWYVPNTPKPVHQTPTRSTIKFASSTQCRPPSNPDLPNEPVKLFHYWQAICLIYLKSYHAIHLSTFVIFKFSSSLKLCGKSTVSCVNGCFWNFYMELNSMESPPPASLESILWIHQNWSAAQL